MVGWLWIAPLLPPALMVLMVLLDVLDRRVTATERTVRPRDRSILRTPDHVDGDEVAEVADITRRAA